MEGKALVDVIQNGISSPVIQGIITALLTTVFLRRDTSLVEFEKLKAGKFEQIINELLENGKMTYLEFYRCRNFLKVAKLADEANKDYETRDTSEQFSFDWFMRFFDAVGNISNIDLQTLWGHVLKNELRTPRSCSLRTLDMIKNMSPEEAAAFNTMCKYVLRSGISYFIFPYGFYDEKEGYSTCRDYMNEAEIYPTSIIPLLEMGALTGDHDLAFHFDLETKLQIHNEKILCLVEGKNAKDILLQQEAYFLTASGIELYNIVVNSDAFNADIEYATLCFKQMKKDNPELNVVAHEILEYGDEPICDSDDLLV